MMCVRTDLEQEQLRPGASGVAALDVAVQHADRIAVDLGKPEQHGQICEERVHPCRIGWFIRSGEVDFVLEPGATAS